MTAGQVAAIVIPLVVPIALGWLVVRTGLLGRDAAHPLSTIFMYVPAPALLIVVLSGEDLSDLLDVRFILATIVLVVGSFAGIYVLFRRVLERSIAVSSIGGMTASGFNSLVLGLSIMLGIFGAEAVGPVVITVIIFLLIHLPITLALLAVGEGDRGRSGGTALESGIVTVTTVAAIVTLPIWVLVADRVWPGAFPT